MLVKLSSEQAVDAWDDIKVILTKCLPDYIELTDKTFELILESFKSGNLLCFLVYKKVEGKQHNINNFTKQQPLELIIGSIIAAASYDMFTDYKSIFIYAYYINNELSENSIDKINKEFEEAAIKMNFNSITTFVGDDKMKVSLENLGYNTNLTLARKEL